MTETLPAFDRLRARIAGRDLGSVGRQLAALPPEVLDLCGIPRSAPGMLAMWAYGASALYAITTDTPEPVPEQVTA